MKLGCWLAIEAETFIRASPREAVEIYRRGSNDRLSTDEPLAMMQEPGMDDYGSKPQGAMRFAEHLFRIGLLKTKPSAWTGYFFPVSHGLGGN